MRNEQCFQQCLNERTTLLKYRGGVRKWGQKTQTQNQHFNSVAGTSVNHSLKAGREARLTLLQGEKNALLATPSVKALSFLGVKLPSSLSSQPGKQQPSTAQVFLKVNRWFGFCELALLLPRKST